MGMIPPVTNREFQSVIDSMNKNAAPGSDGISPQLLLQSMPILRPVLFLIMQSCLTLGFFPKPWKEVKVVVIGKPGKDSYDSLGSFRPISLTGCLSKILEGLVLGRLTWFARAQSWFSDSQHGFDGALDGDCGPFADVRH